MIKLGAIIYAIMLCHGAFEYRSGNPDLLFPVQSAIHDYSTPVVMMTPALLPFADGLLVNSSMSRPYSEQDLTTGSSVVQYGRGRLRPAIVMEYVRCRFFTESIPSL